MKQVDAQKITIPAKKLKKLSFQILVTLGMLSNYPAAYAGSGEVCSDESQPTSAHQCSNGATVIPTYYANSPKLRKFVDTLPGLTAAGTNTFADGYPGSYIPVAVKDSLSYSGSDYYELAVVEYSQKMHSDLQKPTTLRGYIQIDRTQTNNQTPATISNNALALKYPDGTQIYVTKEKGMVNGVWDHTLDRDSSGNPIMVAAIALDKPHYLGPTIVAKKGVPTRVKMNNLLPKGRAGVDANGKVIRNGDMFLPVDESLPGAGQSTVALNTFPQNRAAIHLHGGDSPWISDGTPHQWFSSETDATINPLLKRGDRAFNVPDMPYPGEAAQTLFWPNNQSARLMWYHDHSFGLTRQNAYAGEAAPYLITDVTEDAALSTAVPAEMIPLVIQDKTFVANDIATQDSKWDQAHWGTPGDLWYPHVYEPNIIDHDINTGAPINPPIKNPAGRWDYGPTADGTASTPAVLPLPNGSYGQVSVGPEAYMDTAMVNGVAYPTLTVEPKAYRVRLLNGANDRYFNLSLWLADNTVTSQDGRTNTEVKMVPEILPSTFTVTDGGSGYVSPQVIITDQGGYGGGASASAQVDVNGEITAINLTNPGSGYINPQVQITDTSGQGALVSIQTIAGRPAGIPDPANVGPVIIQFGNEAGLLPKPVIHHPKAMDFNSDGTETGGGFYLGNAERGDTVIDFSQYAGKTLILYNDSTAPVPDGDSRYDYFTGNPDQTSIGGAASTLPGYGPNTRTVMQIKVSATLTGGGSASPAYDTTGRGGPLETVLPSVYAAIADTHIEPGVIADGNFNNMTLADWKAAHSGITLSTKTIEGGFDVNFGRLIANFGAELPSQNASTWLAYIDKPTDIVEDGKIQYWHIKNNDADNHPIHFHLFNVQVIARVDQLTGLLINPNPNEAGWKETVQNWPFQDVIVALKPKTPVLPFGLPDSVRLMDPTLNDGDATNTSLDQNYINGGVSSSSIPLAFQQYDLVTGAFVPPHQVTNNGITTTTPGVVNDLQNFGWEYVYHCHILGHEENDLMRPMKFLPIASLKPVVPTAVSLDNAKGKITWVDPTPINGVDANSVSTNGNPGNEIGFRIEYAPNINGVVNSTSFTNATPIGFTDPLTIIPDNILSNNLQPLQKPTINSLANSVSFDADLAALGPHTDYVFRVVAVNQAGETPSATVALAQAPAAVNNLNASAILANGLTLTWTDTSNETGFTVEFSSDKGVTWQAQGTVPANTTGGTITYPVTGMSQATAYLFRVGSVKAGFPTAISQPISVSTLAGVFVSQPTNLAATSPAGVGVTLNWTDTSNNETSFQVERAIITNGINGAFAALSAGTVTRSKALGTATGGQVAFQDTSAILGTSYAYHVKALSLAGTTTSYSAPSNVVTIALLLSAPTSFTGVQSGANIIVNWLDTSNNETGFQISRSVVDPFSKASLGAATLLSITSTAAQKTAVGAARTYTDTTALPGITYSYSIASVNGTITSSWVAMTPTTLSMPINAPTVPTATITKATSISLAWTDLSVNETGFLVERMITPSVPVAGAAPPGWTTLTTVARTAAQKTGVNTAVSYVDNLVAPIVQGTYQYRITAVNATGTVINSSSPSVASAPLAFIAPVAPSALAATVTAGVTGVVNLSWTDNANNETGFTLQRATNAAFTTGLVSTAIPGANASSIGKYQLTGLKKGAVLYFRLQATNTVGVSSWTSTATPVTIP